MPSFRKKKRYSKKGSGIFFSRKRSRFYRRYQRGGKFYRKYKKPGWKSRSYSSKKQKIMINRRSVFPVTTSLDRKRYKIRTSYDMTTLTNHSITWDPVQQTGPYMGGWSDLVDPKNTFGHNFFNDGKMCQLQSQGTSYIPGDDIIGQNYSYLYITSVTIDWKVARTDHSGDYDVECIFFPTSPQQFDETGKVNNIPFYPPENTPSYNSWQAAKLYPGGFKMKVSGGFGSKTFAARRIHIPMKKYMIPGFPLASQAFWTTTNNQPHTAWTAPGQDYSVFGNYLFLCPINGQVLLHHKISITWNLTAFQPYGPSKIFAYAVCGPTGTSGSTGDNGTGMTGPLDPPIPPPHNCCDEEEDMLSLTKPILKRFGTGYLSYVSEYTGPTGLTGTDGPLVGLC